MKKVLCILLCALIAFSGLGLYAAAEDGLVDVFYVELDDDAVGYVLIPLNADGQYNSTYKTDDDDIANGSFYVPDGGTIRFVVEYTGSYAPNFMTTVRYIASNRFKGAMNGDPALAENEAQLLTPDANGVYTISNITEDICVTVYNVKESGLSSIIDFVKQLIAFLADVLMKFFGIDIGLGDEY